MALWLRLPAWICNTRIPRQIAMAKGGKDTGTEMLARTASTIEPELEMHFPLLLNQIGGEHNELDSLIPQSSSPGCVSESSRRSCLPSQQARTGKPPGFEVGNSMSLPTHVL